MTTITAADQFCGAGGFSTGLRWAVQELEREQGRPINLQLVAINHWDVAVATHAANHPDVHHICDNLEKADPRTLFPDGKLRLLISSPECTYFSRALGGKPRNWQSRATSKYVIKWATCLDVDDIIIENVSEFQNWGPLYRRHADPAKIGQPIPSRKGQYFRAFIAKLRAMGYCVEWRILVCADYGDPTSRQRLFIRARKGGRPITWPAATHAPARAVNTRRPLKPYVIARDIIDWDNLGTSVFNREKILSENTMRRIMMGFAKFSGLTFMVPLHSESPGQMPRTHAIDAPLPTIATQRNPLLIQPQPYLVKYYNTSTPFSSVDEPIPTITANFEHIGLAQPFVLSMEHSTDASGHSRRVFHPGLPLPTITTRGVFGLAQPFIIKFYGNGTAVSTADPLPTVTTKDRFALCVPFTNGYVVLDIFFRMLTPAEMARAHSLGHYTFTGKRNDVVKQIGNSVPALTAKSLCYSALAY